MTTKKRSIITSLVLVALVVATMSVGYVSAHGTESPSPASLNYDYYDFWLSCPAGGTTDLATPRTKEATPKDAYYNLTTVTNNTGLSFYVNVRSENGSTIVGYAEERNSTGAFFVDYLPGYGNVGTSYRPSGQTDKDATKPVYFEGTWRP